MKQKLSQGTNGLTLVLNSSDNSFGFAYKEANNDQSEILFIKKFNNDLCNNLIVDFEQFISRENLKKVQNIAVSIGPSNFNASRQVVVLARTISQQLSIPIESFSSFFIMSKELP